MTEVARVIVRVPIATLLICNSHALHLSMAQPAPDAVATEPPDAVATEEGNAGSQQPQRRRHRNEGEVAAQEAAAKKKRQRKVEVKHEEVTPTKDPKEVQPTSAKKPAAKRSPAAKEPASSEISHSSKGRRAPESETSKDRRKELMAFRKSKEATGVSFEDGSAKKMPVELQKQCQNDPLAFFEVWQGAQGNYNTVVLTLSKTEKQKKHNHRQHEWMDEDDLLVDKCKGNRVKFESMKRKLTTLGRCRPNPDMESDTEGNLQFKPLTHDQESSHSEDEMVSQITATGSGSANKDSFKKQIESQGLKSRTKTRKAEADREKKGEEATKSKEEEEEERRQAVEKEKKDAKKARKKDEPLERGKSWMFKLPALLRDIDGSLKEMTSQSCKVSVPEKYLQEFGASLKTAKTELVDYRTKFERINSVQDTKQYQKRSADFLVPAENAAEGGRKSVKAAKSTFSVYLNAKQGSK